jgi:hypothetical protein
MGEGEATWPATSVSLIIGERDAVMSDTVLRGAPIRALWSGPNSPLSR